MGDPVRAPRNCCRVRGLKPLPDPRWHSQQKPRRQCLYGHPKNIVSRPFEPPVEVGFRCPQCLGELTGRGDAIACIACGQNYPEHGGIFDFRWHRHDYYFNPVPREEMAQLVRDAPNLSWDEMVRSFVRFVKNVPDWIDNVAVNGRYAWKLMLDLPPDGRFLDFGCGLGNLAQNVAPHVRETVALDLTWERLQFARQRFARFNPRDRITLVAGGDGPHLPFPDAHFDCIALSGVLEWIADDTDSYGAPGSPLHKAWAMLMSFFGDSNPRRTQLRFLRELRRILKPGGQLFVGIENRWGYEYFVGRPDHHSGLPLGSLLPRFAANVYSIARSHRPYRTYTHSFGGMRRLFAAAGMPRQELYGLTPGYSHLREIVPAWTDQPFWDPASPRHLADRLKRSRHFVPAFGMIAQASGDRPEPLVGRLLGQVSQHAHAGRLTLSECLISGKDKIVLKAAAGSTGVIIKLPADATSRAGEARNARVLGALARQPIPNVPVPGPLTQGTLQGLDYYVEHAASGTPLAHAARTIDRGTFATKVAKLVCCFAASGIAATAIGPGSAIHRRLAVEVGAKLRDAGADANACTALTNRVSDMLTSRPWRLGFTHGDLSVHNLFVDNGEISGVIDWEYSDDHGLPVLDLIAYLESRQRLEDTASTVSSNLIRLSRFDWPCEEEVGALRSLYGHFGIYPACHEALCLLAWLAHVDRQLDTVTRFDPTYTARVIVPMLAHFGIA